MPGSTPWSVSCPSHVCSPQSLRAHLLLSSSRLLWVTDRIETCHAGSAAHGAEHDEEKLVFLEDLLNGDDEADSDDNGGNGAARTNRRLLNALSMSDGGRRAPWRPSQRVTAHAESLISSVLVLTHARHRHLAAVQSWLFVCGQILDPCRDAM